MHEDAEPRKQLFGISNTSEEHAYSSSFTVVPDGCKPGEAAHTGTGVLVLCAYFTKGSSNTAWYAMQMAPVTN